MLNSFSFNHGTEGPRNDPYSFEEVSFTNLAGETLAIHDGLNCFVEGEEVINAYDLPYNMQCVYGGAQGQALWDIFCAFCGVDEKVITRLKNKYWEDYYSDPMGYPEMYE